MSLNSSLNQNAQQTGRYQAATEEIKAYANDLRAATNDLDVAVKALAPAEE